MVTKKSVKKAKKPTEKPVELVISKGTISKVESSNTPAPEAATAAVPVAAPAAAPAAVPEPKKIDLTKEPIKGAIAQGLELIHSGKSKADAARAIFGVLKDEQKDAIVAAFVAGATLTDKGALTYWYNCKRKAKKEAGAAS